MSTAGLRMSPASPPVQHTSTVCTPSSWYRATVALPLRRLVVGVRVHGQDGRAGCRRGRRATRVDGRRRHRLSPTVTLSVRERPIQSIAWRAVEYSRCSARSRRASSSLLVARRRRALAGRVRRAPLPSADRPTPARLALAIVRRRVRVRDPRRAGRLRGTRRRAGRDRRHPRPADEPGRAASAPWSSTTADPATPGPRRLRAPRTEPVPDDPRPLRPRELRPPRHGQLATRSTASTTRRSSEPGPRTAPPTASDELAELLRRHARSRSISSGRASLSNGAWLARRRARATWRATSTGSGPRSASAGSPSSATRTAPSSAPCTRRSSPTRSGRWCSTRAVDLSSTTRSSEQRGNAAGFEHALDAFLADCARTTPSARSIRDGDPRAALARPPRPVRSGLDAPDATTAAPVGVHRVLRRRCSRALYARERLADPRRGAPRRGRRRRRRRASRPLSDTLRGSTRRRHVRQLPGGDRHHHLRRPTRAARVVRRVPRARTTSSRRDFPVFGPVLGGSPGRVRSALPAPRRRRAARRRPGRRTRRRSSSSGRPHDPATPYAGAQDLQRASRGSRAPDARRHAARRRTRRAIACVDDDRRSYLLARASSRRADARCAASLIGGASARARGGQTSTRPMSRMPARGPATTRRSRSSWPIAPPSSADASTCPGRATSVRRPRG